jgi:hypothetical protein
MRGTLLFLYVFSIGQQAAAGETDDFMRKMKAMDAVVLKFGPPIKSCVTAAAQRFAIATNEQAPVAAQAAVGSCEMQFQDFFRACPIYCEDIVTQLKSRERQRAITIVVETRARANTPREAPPPPAAPPPPKEHSI